MKRVGVATSCGGSDPDTRDHVIPDSYFANPRPKNLLTFPAHRTCNARYKLSHEYTRTTLASLGMEKSATADSQAPQKYYKMWIHVRPLTEKEYEADPRSFRQLAMRRLA